jgi:GTPase
LQDKEALLPLAQKFSADLAFDEIHFVSAENGSGVENLLAAIAKRLPEEHWHYDPDTLTDMPMRVLAAEAVREHLYDRLHQELPYDALVETERFEERKDGSAAIHILVTVKRDGQKALVLGQGGRTVKAIGQAARQELSQAWGRKIHLFIQVRVRPDWDKHYDPRKLLGI